MRKTSDLILLDFLLLYVLYVKYFTHTVKTIVYTHNDAFFIILGQSKLVIQI